MLRLNHKILIPFFVKHDQGVLNFIHCFYFVKHYNTMYVLFTVKLNQLSSGLGCGVL